MLILLEIDYQVQACGVLKWYNVETNFVIVNFIKNHKERADTLA
jgi:hypothetical protein